MNKYFLIVFAFTLSSIYSQSALEIIKITDSRLRGDSSYAEMTITIVRPKWEKKMALKSWSKGTDYSVSLVTSPAKEKGSVFLKRKKRHGIIYQPLKEQLNFSIDDDTKLDGY